jgi:ADP-heptose:LPS heptosyltransferase
MCHLVVSSKKLTINKDWFVEDWKKLVSLLTKSFDVVQVGGKDEEPIEGVTTYLMGVTSVRQTMALLKTSLTYISVDSFISHAGAAVKKSGVVLFGRSNPFIFGHDLNTNIWIEGSCEFNNLGCGRPETYWGDSELYKGIVRPWECPSRSCMKAITPDLVIDKVYRLIEKIR